MEPGIEIDSLLARKIWRVLVVNDAETGQSYMVGQDRRERVPVPPFSTDTTEAHRIVRYFKGEGWTIRVESVPQENGFQAVFYKPDNKIYRFSRGHTVAHAICMAALALIGGLNVQS